MRLLTSDRSTLLTSPGNAVNMRNCAHVSYSLSTVEVCWFRSPLGHVTDLSLVPCCCAGPSTGLLVRPRLRPTCPHAVHCLGSSNQCATPGQPPMAHVPEFAAVHSAHEARGAPLHDAVLGSTVDNACMHRHLGSIPSCRSTQFHTRIQCHSSELRRTMCSVSRSSGLS